MPEKRVDAVVKGRVQGVGFRWYVQRSAVELGLVGWVKNLPNGSVQLVAEGSTEGLGHLLQSIDKSPGPSRVESVEARWLPGSGEFSSFRIVH